MKRFLLLCVFFLTCTAHMHAAAEVTGEPETAAVIDNTAIPFKQEKTLAQQSSPIISVLLMFIVVAAVFFYFFKNKLSLVTVPGEKNIQVLEVKRLSQKLSVFHIKVKNRELLVLQSGDTVKTLDINDESDKSVES